MTRQGGEGGGTFRVAVLNEILAKFNSLPECVKATAKSLALKSFTDRDGVEFAEGQQTASGLSRDTANAQETRWYYVSLRFVYHPASHHIVIVHIETPILVEPMN